MKTPVRKLSFPTRFVAGILCLSICVAIIGFGAFYVDNSREENSRHAWTYSSASDFVHDDPDNPNSHAALASVYTEQKNYAQAVEEFRLAVRMAPNDASMHYYLGMALKNAGQDNVALKEFQTTIKLDVSNGWPAQKSVKMIQSQ